VLSLRIDMHIVVVFA